MNSRAYLNLANYDSIDLYLPFIGSALALSYAFKRRKNCIVWKWGLKMRGRGFEIAKGYEDKDIHIQYQSIEIQNM